MTGGREFGLRMGAAAAGMFIAALFFTDVDMNGLVVLGVAAAVSIAIGLDWRSAR